MKKIILLLWLPVLAALHTQARHACAENRIAARQLFSTAKTAIASPYLEQYDIKYVKLDLSVSNLNTSISGSATTTATVTASAGMNIYAFELDSATMIIDSVRFNGSPKPVIRTGNVCTVSLGSTLSTGSSFTAQVFYHGTSLVGSGFFTHGLVHDVLPSGTNITYSLSDPFLAKDWWPCKQSLTDKIDSADLWFTVPAGTKAGSNGLLLNTTPIGSSVRYEWKTRYPIEYYLVSFAVAPYVDRRQTVHFSGSTDSMLIQHFVYDTATFLPLYGSAIDSTPYMVDYFSTLYGRYPFWKEKYGHCTAPLGGGMEHQTMTTLGAYTTPLIAHELGHQWWGDHVTYASWQDIWLSEGWAAYNEQLYVEHFQSPAAAKAYRTAVFNRAMGSNGGSVYVDDTTKVFRVFDSRLTYDKGAAVAHMLRYIAPGDSVFFSGLRAYQQRYAFKTATTDSFRTVMEAAYGRKLDTFFNQWIYGQGFPWYSGIWNQKGNDIFISLSQTTSFPSVVTAFAMPLELKLQSNAGDTTVNVYFNSASQLYSFKWSKTMTGFIIDPNNNVVNRDGGISNDPTLGVLPTNNVAPRIFPNPTKGSWELNGLIQGSNLKLIDAAGHLIWQRDNAPQHLNIDSTGLPAGIYMLEVQVPDKLPRSYKLEKL
jgi:aminopeptidase N